MLSSQDSRFHSICIILWAVLISSCWTDPTKKIPRNDIDIIRDKFGIEIDSKTPFTAALFIPDNHCGACTMETLNFIDSLDDLNCRLVLVHTVGSGKLDSFARHRENLTTILDSNEYAQRYGFMKFSPACYIFSSKRLILQIQLNDYKKSLDTIRTIIEKR